MPEGAQRVKQVTAQGMLHHHPAGSSNPFLGHHADIFPVRSVLSVFIRPVKNNYPLKLLFHYLMPAYRRSRRTDIGQ